MTDLAEVGVPSKPQSKPSRAQLFRRAALLLLVLTLATFLVYRLVGQSGGKDSLTVALLLREQNALAEQVIRAGVQDLIDAHNARSGTVPLKLEVFVSEKGTRLEEHFKAIAKRVDIVAVIDNSWGVELSKEITRAFIEQLDRPIIFLNGDRFADAHNRPWMFLGASDHIPAQLARIIEDIRSKAPNATTAYLIEHDPKGLPYPPADEALKKLQTPASDTAGTATERGASKPVEIVLPCAPGWQLPDRNALMRVRSHLLTALPDHAAESRKVVVLFVHSSWGSELVRWIDGTFRNTTIVAYQSALSRDRPVPLREGTGNELVLLGQSATAAPHPLVEMHNRLRAQDPKVFANQGADLFYLRRALVAFEVLEGTIRAGRAQMTNLNAPPVQVAISERAAAAIRALKAKTFASRLGLLAFDEQGVERGNNHTVLRRGSLTDSYPLQLDDRDSFLPNLQVLFSHVRAMDLDIRQGTMRISMVLTVRCATSVILETFERSHEKKDLSPEAATQRLDVVLANLLRFGDVDESHFSRRLVGSRSLGRLTELQYTIEGTCRLRDMQPWWYPFDTHAVRVPLNIMQGSNRVRVSVDQLQRLALRDARDSELAGWSVLDVGVSIDHQVGGSSLHGDAALAQPVQTQFSTIDLNLMLRRRPWSAFLLVYMPLLLISVGSTAVLFIKLGDKSAAGIGSEILKTQSELCLGCVLAAVTYLISYAGLVPRMERPLYCDTLLGATLAIVSCNFIFIVAFADRTSNPLLQFWDIRRYRVLSALVAIGVFGAWPAVGFM